MPNDDSFYKKGINRYKNTDEIVKNHPTDINYDKQIDKKEIENIIKKYDLQRDNFLKLSSLSKTKQERDYNEKMANDAKELIRHYEKLISYTDWRKNVSEEGNFKKIAKKAAKEYGSKEAGLRVAGAIKAKMAAKESTNLALTVPLMIESLKWATKNKLTEDHINQYVLKLINNSRSGNILDIK